MLAFLVAFFFFTNIPNEKMYKYNRFFLVCQQTTAVHSLAHEDTLKVSIALINWWDVQVKLLSTAMRERVCTDTGSLSFKSPLNASLAFPLNYSLLSHAERSYVRGPLSDCDDNVSQAAECSVVLCRRKHLLKGATGGHKERRVVWSSRNVMSYFL